MPKTNIPISNSSPPDYPLQHPSPSLSSRTPAIIRYEDHGSPLCTTATSSLTNSMKEGTQRITPSCSILVYSASAEGLPSSMRTTLLALQPIPKVL